MNVDVTEIAITLTPDVEPGTRGSFTYTGESVATSEDGRYNSILLPPSNVGDQSLIVFSLETPGLRFGTSPVQWIELQEGNLEYLKPEPPNPEDIRAVTRLSSTVCQITELNNGKLVPYRFILSVFYQGQALYADPTIVNLPPEPPDPGSKT